MALSDFQIKALRPPAAGRVEHVDGTVPGLALRVSANGTMAWLVRTRCKGELLTVTLGKYRLPSVRDPIMGLSAARKAAKAAIGQAHDGINPNVEKRAARKERERAKAFKAETGFKPGSFGLIATKYFKHEKSRLRRGWEIENIVNRELMPAWCDKPMAEIRKRDGLDLIEALVEAGKPAAANRLQEIVIRIFNWALAKDLITATPFVGMEPAAPKVRRSRTLSDAEIVEVWRAADALAYPYGRMVQLLLATGQRRNEVAEMRRDELNLDDGTWTIPEARSKSKRAHVVPLSELARSIIIELPKIKSKFAFPAGDGDTAISGFSKAKRRLDELIAKARADADNKETMEGWTLHDLRRSVATGMARLGVTQHVIGKVLNHAERSITGTTYNRYEYLDEKRHALTNWAAHLERLITPPSGNVVALDERRVTA